MIFMMLKNLGWGLRKEKGQGMVEYALIIGLVAVALIVALGALTGSIEGIFNSVVEALGGSTS
jgi:pilus assembly protein Flp/PilA